MNDSAHTSIISVEWTGRKLLAFFVSIAFLVYMDRGKAPGALCL